MANSQVIADNDKKEVELDTPVIFSANNAEKISYSITDGYDYNDNKSADADGIQWDAPSAGEFIATVTAELSGSAPKKVTILINVTAPKQTPSLTFSPTSVSIKEGEAFTAPVLTTDPEGLEVTYTSSNEAVATIVDNKVTLTGTPGTTTITATFAGNAKYYTASATYTLTVTKKVLTGIDVYEIVTSSDQLVDGAKYVLVSKPFKISTVSYGTYILGAPKSSNKGFDAIKLNPDATDIPAIYDLSEVSDYSELTLESSTTENSWYINIDGKYLNGTKKSELKLGTMTQNITISINENGNAILTTGKDTDKDISIQLYAQNSNGKCANEIFNAYSSVQHPVVLYKKIQPAIPSINIDSTDFEGNETISLEGKDKVTIMLKHEDTANHTIFHKFVSANSQHNAPALQSDNNDDFIEYSKPIEITEAGKLHYYAQHNASGVKSEIRTLTFTGNTTSISEISVKEEEAEWYDLSGRRVASPAKGVYIMKQGSKVSKRAF